MISSESDKPNAALTPGSRYMQPLLRWAGSKRKLVPVLQSLVPKSFLRYIEPFAGSACLFFAIKPAAAILSDLNPELMHTYSVVRSHPKLVCRAAHGMPKTRRYYYKLRSISSESLDDVARAARFIYLNRYCFNGVFRTNLAGHFNVPRGTKTGELPSEKEFVRASIALRRAELRTSDFESCMRNVRCGDFVYLDPPYAQRWQRNRGEYGPGCFEHSDLPRLFESLQRIHDVGGVFLLSYASSPTLLRELRSWHVTKLSVRRHVSGFAEHRQLVEEIIVSNAPQTSLSVH